MNTYKTPEHYWAELQRSLDKKFGAGVRPQPKPKRDPKDKKQVLRHIQEQRLRLDN